VVFGRVTTVCLIDSVLSGCPDLDGVSFPLIEISRALLYVPLRPSITRAIVIFINSVFSFFPP